MHGGHQKKGFRPGTENIAAIVGIGKACEVMIKEELSQMEKRNRFRNHL
jgi:cysteine desulfurase